MPGLPAAVSVLNSILVPMPIAGVPELVALTCSAGICAAVVAESISTVSFVPSNVSPDSPSIVVASVHTANSLLSGVPLALTPPPPAPSGPTVPLLI